jgi:hypothetical protein
VQCYSLKTRKHRQATVEAKTADTASTWSLLMYDHRITSPVAVPVQTEASKPPRRVSELEKYSTNLAAQYLHAAVQVATLRTVRIN